MFESDTMFWSDVTGVTGSIAHCEPAVDFGGDSAQYKDAGVARHIALLLDREGAEFQGFGSAPLLSREDVFALWTEGQLAAYDVLADLDPLPPVEPSGSLANGPVSVACTLDPPPGAPVPGDVHWFAEIYGEDGVSSEGLTVTPNPGDSTQVVVEIDESVVGDVVLFASYLTTDGRVVFARPVLIRSSGPAGATLTGIEVQPEESFLSIGDRLRPEIFRTYNDGSRWRSWLTSNDLAVVSADPSVVDASNVGNWEAVAAGSVTVTVTYLGFDATSALDVFDPFPTRTFDEWREDHFTEDELADPLISGPDADGEPDGLTLLQEYCFAGHPRIAEDFPPLRIAMADVSGSLQPAILCRLSTTATDCELAVQQAISVVDAQWEEFYNFTMDPNLASPLVVDYSDGGYFVDLVLAGTSSVPANAFYRLYATNSTWESPPQSTNSIRVTMNDRNDTYPEWHPSQHLITFITDRVPFPGAPNLGAVQPDGSSERLMASGVNSGSYGLVRSMCWAGPTPHIFVEERLHNHEFLEFNVPQDGFRRTVTNGNDAAFAVRLAISGGGLGICGSRDGSTVMWRHSSNGGTGTMSLRSALYSSLPGTVKSSATHGTVVVSVYDSSEFLLYWGFALTPDGSQAIVPRKSGTGRDLFRYNTDGTGVPVQLTHSGQLQGSRNEWPDVSPDGQRIAFTYGAEGEPTDIAVIGISGNHFWNVTQTPEVSEGAPSWSPDATQLAAQRYDTAESGGLEPGESPTWNIYVYDLPE